MCGAAILDFEVRVSEVLQTHLANEQKGTFQLRFPPGNFEIQSS